MFSRLLAMLIKEFTQILRDNRIRGVIFVLPILQLGIFANALGSDVRNVPAAVVDLDQTPASRLLTSKLFDGGIFREVARLGSDEDVQKCLDSAQAQAVFRIDSGFQRNLQAGHVVPVQILVDGSDSNTAAIIMQFAGRVFRDYAQDLRFEQMRRRMGRLPVEGRLIRLESRAFYNENLLNRNFFIPGVIVIIVSLVSLLLTGMAIVREKEIGTLEQLLVTPITPMEFVLGKTIPFACIGMIEVVLVVSIGVFGFEIPFRGQLWVLFLGTAFYLLTTLSIGLYISTVSKTQQQAMVSAFFFMLPAVLLSGFSFPIANMPETIQHLTYLNPLRFFLEIVRGVFLKGLTVSQLSTQFSMLAIMGFLMLTLASRRFQKTIS